MRRTADNTESSLSYALPTLRAWLTAWTRAACLRLGKLLKAVWAGLAQQKTRSLASGGGRFGVGSRCGNTLTLSLNEPRFEQKTAGQSEWRALYLLIVFAIPLFIAPAFGDVSKEYQLKAVFLWRLAQFATWPIDAFESADSPILICVLGDNPFGNALHAAVAGETAHGRRLVVQQHRVVEQVRSCHILYITGAGPRQAKAITTSLAGKSVLTVRDVDGPATAYDTIVSFVTEQNRIKLLINVKAAAAAQLVLDPRLLRSADIVGD